MTVRCLTIHAQYGCRHSGACCTSEWPIPVEEDRLATLTTAVEDGQLVARSSLRPLWLRPASAPASASTTYLQFDDVGCVFYDVRDGGRCRVHRSLGHDALPLACRQFPRVSVLDPRGASVTLSHYCPTAAGLLEESMAIAITDRPTAFPAGSEIVGLDASSSLPPLLTPTMLMDWDAWWDWERRAVDALAHAGRPPEEGLGVLRAAVEEIRRWTPADGLLLPAIDAAFRGASTIDAPERGFTSVLSDVLETIPETLRPHRLDPIGPPSTAATRGFLAAHAFANWTAHLGKGLRSWLRSVEAAYVLVSELGVRQADLLLRHLADVNELARVWSRAEAD